MEVQSNPIPESASIRYAGVWAGFSASVQRGEFKSLSSYCRLTHTSYEGIRHWIRSRGMSVKSLKKSKGSPEAALITGVAETKSVSFIQFAPSAPAAAYMLNEWDGIEAIPTGGDYSRRRLH